MLTLLIAVVLAQSGGWDPTQGPPAEADRGLHVHATPGAIDVSFLEGLPADGSFALHSYVKGHTVTVVAVDTNHDAKRCACVSWQTLETTVIVPPGRYTVVFKPGTGWSDQRAIVTVAR